MKQGQVLMATAALGLALALAPSVPAQAQRAPGVLPPQEIVTILHSTGLRPVGRPVRRGPAYAITAIDRAGEEVRVVIDARDGEIISVRPLVAYGPPYGPPPGAVYLEPEPMPMGPPVVVYDERPIYAPEAPPGYYDEPRVIPAPGATGSLPRPSGRAVQQPAPARTQTARVAGPPPIPRPRPEVPAAAPAPVQSWPDSKPETDAAPLPPPVPDGAPAAE